MCCFLLSALTSCLCGRCSLNPIENEAVVMELVRSSAGALRIIDCTEKVPLFRRRPGLLSWRVMNSAGEWVDSSVTKG